MPAPLLFKVLRNPGILTKIFFLFLQNQRMEYCAIIVLALNARTRAQKIALLMHVFKVTMDSIYLVSPN